MNRILFFAYLGLTACASATIGKPFDNSKVKDLKLCESDRSVVRAKLGQPYLEGYQSGLESDIYSYIYSRASAFGGEGTQAAFIAFYDKQGKLVDMALNPMGTFQPANQCRK